VHAQSNQDYRLQLVSNMILAEKNSMRLIIKKRYLPYHLDESLRLRTASERDGGQIGVSLHETQPPSKSKILVNLSSVYP
jgi:hypothetical protein